MVDAPFATRLIGELDADLQRDARLGKVRRYLAGEHDLPYMPRGARREFRHLAERSITPWLHLLPDTYAQGLHVDGYRTVGAADNGPGWDRWQANGLDARQSIAHRGALEYGTSYVLTLPGSRPRRVPVIRPLSPLRSLAWYQDDDDEWPEIALRDKGRTLDGTRLFEVFDRTNVYAFAEVEEETGGVKRRRLIRSRVDEHGLGVTPVTRFRDRLDGEAVGLIRPNIVLQNRINEVVFATLIALQYASFRQRWATGLAVPTGPDGKAIEPFEAAVDRLWVATSEGARFGDFAQTELSGHHQAYQQAISTLAGTNQVSPSTFSGDVVNVSAEGLAQMERATTRRTDGYATLFGEAWEQTLRLAALAAGDTAGASDTAAQVRWRDHEARSLAQTVDALGKVAQMLEVPPEALWEKIPGVTDQDVEAWRTLREQGSALDRLAASILSEDEPVEEDEDEPEVA